MTDESDLIYTSVISAIKKEVPEGSPLLLAFSGGVDSLVLFRVLAAWGGRPLVAAHMNHGLREQADADADFVRRLCREHGVPLYLTKTDIGSYARGASLSIEEAARNRRLAFLENVRSKMEHAWLVFGHHGNDRAETLLFNFIRGTGVHGLATMKPCDPGRQVIRPLLPFRKEEIISYARAKGWAWVEDTTNHESEHDRNWLRNEIIPRLEERRSGTVSRLMQAAERFEAMSDFVKGQAEVWLQAHAGARPSGDIPIAAFNDLHPIMQGEVLLSLYRNLHGSPQGFSSKMATRIQGWLARHPHDGEVFFGKSAVLRARGHYFCPHAYPKPLKKKDKKIDVCKP